MPWVVVVPLLAIIVYLLASGPLSLVTVIPAVGVALAALVASSGAVASFTPDARAWSYRAAVITADGITVLRPGRDPFFLAFGDVDRIHTHPEPAGLRIPPAIQVVTDFYGRDGRKVPELAVHHSTYRYAVRRTDRNPDGPMFLNALRDTPAPLDAGSRALLELAFGEQPAGSDGLSGVAFAEARAGRLFHAIRAAERDATESGRTSATLVRLSLVLRHQAVATARAGVDDHPRHPVFTYYLAHALLSDIGVSGNPGPVARSHRSELRGEARTLLEGLVDDPVFGEAARRELVRLRV